MLHRCRSLAQNSTYCTSPPNLRLHAKEEKNREQTKSNFLLLVYKILCCICWAAAFEGGTRATCLSRKLPWSQVVEEVVLSVVSVFEREICGSDNKHLKWVPQPKFRTLEKYWSFPKFLVFVLSKNLASPPLCLLSDAYVCCVVTQPQLEITLSYALQQLCYLYNTF